MRFCSKNICGIAHELTMSCFSGIEESCIMRPLKSHFSVYDSNMVGLVPSIVNILIITTELL